MTLDTEALNFLSDLDSVGWRIRKDGLISLLLQAALFSATQLSPTNNLFYHNGKNNGIRQTHVIILDLLKAIFIRKHSTWR